VRLAVRVPATVANLGPGFDCMALAADLHNGVDLQTDGPPVVTVEGEGTGELPADASNLIVRSMVHLAHQVGGRLPGFALSCRNAIPLQRGLGSSASAVVAGLLLADRLMDAGLPAERLLEMAVDLEGHADNVAAALHGGMVLVYLADGGWRVERLQPHPSLRPVLLVPLDERVATDEARRVLTPEVPRSAATFNAARAALLVLALTQRPGLLPEAVEDRLHQQARLRLAPGSRALFAELKESGIPVCVAGSGPTLLAFEGDRAVVPDLGPGWRVIPTSIAPRGAQVRDI
jgi:homoserine kinase